MFEKFILEADLQIQKVILVSGLGKNFQAQYLWFKLLWMQMERHPAPQSAPSPPVRTPSPARSIFSIMSFNNRTLSISLSRHNLILRSPPGQRQLRDEWRFLKKISNIHLPPNYWMKNWEYIIHRVLILRSSTPKFRIHLSPDVQRGWESSRVWLILQIVLCMTVKCEILLTDGKANQYPKKLS